MAKRSTTARVLTRGRKTATKKATHRSTKRPSKKVVTRAAKKARHGVSRQEGEAYVWNRAVAARTLDETAFILLKSRMVRLNPTGTRIWELFERGASLASVVDQVVDEFETTRARALVDARGFVKELCRRELLVPLTRETGRPL